MPDPIQIVEALLFASDSPVEAEQLRELLELPGAAEARALVEELRARYEVDGRPLTIVEVGGGFKMVTRPELASWLVRLARSRTRSRLSRPALETLAVVAYRQPVSRPEIDMIRGVNSEAVIEGLLERRMIRIAGRKDAPGRPFLYETTREFLVAFGLRNLDDLPKMKRDLGGVSADEAAAASAGGREPGPPALLDDTPQQDSGRSGAGLTPGE
jgi:segregation and condensation protein B